MAHFIYTDDSLNQEDYIVELRKVGKCAKIDDETIERWIDEGIKKLTSKDNGDSWYITSGDTFLFMRLLDDEIAVHVTTTRMDGTIKI
jgi:hypothetical protein